MSGKKFFSKKSIYLVCILACLCLGACDAEKTNNRDSSFSVEQDNANSRQEIYDCENIVSAQDLDKVPEYSGNAYVTINNNIPFFDSREKKNLEAFEKYSNLDQLNRCGGGICKYL